MNRESQKHLFPVNLFSLLFGCSVENTSKTLRLRHGLDVGRSVHKDMVKTVKPLLMNRSDIKVNFGRKREKKR